MPGPSWITCSDFPAGAGPQGLTASVSVAQVPPQTRTVIIGQIHGADDISSVPFVMLFYTAGAVQVVVKQQQSGDAHINYPLLTDVPLGARFDYGIRDNGDGSLTFTAELRRPARCDERAAPGCLPARDGPLPGRRLPAGQLWRGQPRPGRRGPGHLLRAADRRVTSPQP